ncbi:beta-D-glucosyl crocetin beta-1,6-glucosyltransferase-like [Olea europaea subsp. europaea]|uniref:Beta-D-glucosyl crocetin beta-1,6-glucosyltransferase-like n=1 Tax=Olea europaea subsp. europaea TaxID=158383 RepID=A0A8S0UST5_OLEEU|nr:beta-D-glucosyl crocetin beta-1,6-glucosyltransferase-like [Olea europaea subsp. europaea]
MIAVGPLVTQPDSEEDYSGIMQWLSKKDKFSTLFISFGSENFLSMEQIEELGEGLDICGVNFIWVIRLPVGEAIGINEAPPPEEFLERVQGRGMIVQRWAPQAKILAHPSTGVS